jgi:hypothetical protein
MMQLRLGRILCDRALHHLRQHAAARPTPMHRSELYSARVTCPSPLGYPTRDDTAGAGAGPPQAAPPLYITRQLDSFASPPSLSSNLHYTPITPMRLSAPLRTLSATISTTRIARTTVPSLYIRAMSSAASSTEQLVLTERRGAVTILTLNRPKALNALNTPLFDALNKELDVAEADEGVGAVIITGGEKVFAG